MRIQVKGNSGFTLIEVLISVLILGIGILGVLNLQTRALMDNQDAYLRTQAIFLAYDMSDRIRANAGIWQTAIKNNTVNKITQNDGAGNVKGTHIFCSAYDPMGALANPLADPVACIPMKMAQYDVYRWRKDIESVLNGSATITVCNDPIISGKKNCTSGTTKKDVLRLTISWGRVNQDMQNNLANASYYLDVRP